MDALMLDLVANIAGALSVALLAWGAWLSTQSKNWRDLPILSAGSRRLM